jgi:DNA-binding HxlR family transcriptional regulator
MLGKKIEKHPGCIQHTLQIMGDKWTALIIRDLSQTPARFADLEQSLAGISPRTLSQRLAYLETEGIIAKRLYCERPPRYTYELTHKGKELQDILVKMADWGARNGCPRSQGN